MNGKIMGEQYRRQDEEKGEKVAENSRMGVWNEQVKE